MSALPPPTDEQQAILDFASASTDSFAVEALAGAAKTTTLEMLASGPFRRTSVLCLAFNKAIQVEMSKRFPLTTTCATMNAMGHRAWSTYLGKRLRPDTKKVSNLLRKVIDQEKDTHVRDEMRSDWSLITRSVSLGKQRGFIPECPGSLITAREFYESLPEEPTDGGWKAIIRVSRLSFEAANIGEIDFDDQILLPTITPISFPQYPIVMVDEAQDLSPLNHAMLGKMVGPRTRLVAVGDRNQAIYGFRGADTRSMEKLIEGFALTCFPLTMTFRCAKRIVSEAQWRAPELRCPEDFPPGEVTNRGGKGWAIPDVPDGAAVLCRNNAPLFSLALRLLLAGRRPLLRNTDMLMQVKNTIKSFGNPASTPVAIMQMFDKWASEKRRRAKDEDAINDLIEATRAFLGPEPNIGSTLNSIEQLLASSGTITLSTGHKAKGLEWDRVFILDEHLLRPDDQDMNLRYVMQTRAKRELTYVYSAELGRI